MAEEAEHLQELLNTFKVEDAEALPAPEEKPQIELDDDINENIESDRSLSKESKTLPPFE